VRDWQGKRYWLVGASEGLGKALAGHLSRAGCEVILSARGRDGLDAVAAGLPGKAHVVPMDITDDASVAEAAGQVGQIDGLVLLAGVYWPMKTQAWDAEKAVAMADVNFTGFVRVLGHVVPDFVARDSGHIVITSSLTGFRGLPGSIGYTAAKAGTMSLAECMHADLRNTGVAVQVVNPGFVRTRLTDKNDFRMPQIMEPEAAAREIYEHMLDDSFKKSFPAPLSWLFRLGQFLPDWLYYRTFGR